MNLIDLPVLYATAGTPADFVRCWDRFYSGFDEDFYRNNIGQPLTEERIADWFNWKNGMTPSADKTTAYSRFFSPDEHIGPDADDDALRDFLNRPGGAIWRIFWLHLQHPRRFPIYDQHVHRAMAFVLKWSNREIPAYNPAKVSAYLEHYRPFFDRFGDCERRQVDRALWRFGRFLKTGYGPLITSPAT